MNKTTLLFGVHAHQPVGNFPEVLEEAHLRCYRPFLETLHRFPDFRFSVHFSGWLLDHLLLHYPADMELLREMVARGQVELFGSGWSEPVLAAIPQRDRVGQLAAMSAQLERHFGTRPQGGWLTERVWESSVVPALAQGGIRYVTVDDYHFLCTGKRARELDGYYTTEEDGRTIDVFPISEQLRYRLPFSPVPEALAYLEQLADDGHAAAIYYDDIEKFGIWPETWDWVYAKRWLEQFITAVLASPRVRTATYREFHAHTRSRGIVYLPTTSYIEMNEWTLPAPAAHTYAALVREHKEAQRFDDTKAFLRGGIWRNFLTRYPESNWMHKRVLALSERLSRVPPELRTADMTAGLYRAQANDAYWHGLFGGLYLPHLRRAVYRNVVALEAALDAVMPRAACERRDLDHDGADEWLIHNTEAQAVVRDDGLAALHEFDSYPLAHNFGDTLRRSHEHYHDGIERGASHAPAGGGIASPHDRVDFKHDVSFADVVPDALPRVLFADSYTAADGKRHGLNDYAFAPVEESGPALAFRAAVAGGTVSKQYRLTDARLTVSYSFAGLAGGTFATELNLSLPACDGFSGRYILANGNIPCGFGQPLAQEALTSITLDDRELDGALMLAASTPLALSAQPHFTVSQSEAGFEKIMQAATISLSLPLTPECSTLTLTLEVVARPDATPPR